MGVGDKLEVNKILTVFKLQNGAPNYPALLTIPSAERIQGLVLDKGYEKVQTTMVAFIQLGMESMNLSNSLTADQIIDLSDMIIDSSAEDNLSLQDFVLFMQKMVRGEAGKLFNSMDLPRFMELFEGYRQERHSEYLRLKEEIESQRKISGRNGRTFEVTSESADAKTLLELASTMYQQDEKQ